MLFQEVATVHKLKEKENRAQGLEEGEWWRGATFLHKQPFLNLWIIFFQLFLNTK